MPWDFDTIIEPFRIKSVEPIPLLPREARVAALEEAGHNLFRLPSDAVTIDLLTDSGTGAMSAAQWAGIMIGDESYAGGRSFTRLEAVVRKLTGHPHVLPCHQGRAAERILAQSLLGPESIVISNTHFDTTRANVEAVGAQALDLLEAHAEDSQAPFKGNMDIDALGHALERSGSRVALVMLTLTNNAVGGQPVSMANIRAVSDLCRAAAVPLYLDAARFAENAWFVHTREPGYAARDIPSIVSEMFSLADGFTFSAKKDAIVHIGGLLATRIEAHAEVFKERLILGEGFPTYGGLAGRDLEAMAIGIQEALDPDYLRYRARSVAYFAEGLQAVGFPVITPPGGHAVFIDAGKLLPHLRPETFPGQALAAAFYVEGGVRGVEIGSLMFPGAERELLRLALPRRVYTQAHINYCIEVGARVRARAGSLAGYRVVTAPRTLRHFSAILEPLQA